MNGSEVRVALSQGFRCCPKTLTSETSWPIFSCRFQIRVGGNGTIVDIRRRKSEGYLHLRKPLTVSQGFYGSAVIVNREAGTLDFTS
jgi:hypothetical protein